MERVSEQVYKECAERIGCEVEAFKAIKEVETGGVGGFVRDGKATILFEGHIFWKELQKRGKNPEDYVEGNEDILYPKWTKDFYKGGILEYDRLERAKKIDEEAALSSASWGMFQVMGFNHKSCGYKNVKEFAKKMCESQDEQIKAAAEFIYKHPTMRKALIEKDWTAFAKAYNGPGYEKNHYDEKMEMAYQKITA